MPETAAATDIGFGTTLSKKTTGTTYIVLAEVTELTSPEMARDAVEFTHMRSPEGWREFKPGLKDAGEFGIVYNLIPGAADDAVVADHIEADAVDAWRITFPNGATLDAKAFATAHGRATPIDDRMTGSATFKISGKPVLTAAA